MFTSRRKITKEKRRSIVPITITPIILQTEKDDESELDEDIPKVSVWQVIKKNQPEWMYILFGIFCACAFGAVMPVFSFLFGEVMQILGDEPSSARSKSVPYAIAFLIVGIVAGLGIFFQVSLKYY